MADADVTETKKSSVGLWVGGCVGCCVLVLLLVAGGLYWGYSWVMNWAEERVVQFEEQGFVRDASNQMVVINTPLDEKKVFLAQMATINADVSTDIAIVGQMAEINGEVKGTVFFRGQMLTIHHGATVHGDVDVECQMVTINGDVKGVLRGTFQQRQGANQDVEWVNPDQVDGGATAPSANDTRESSDTDQEESGKEGSDKED